MSGYQQPSTTSITGEVEYVLPKCRAKCRISNQGSTLAVLLCHPWGLLGGNMHNNVIVACVLFFREQLKLTTLRLDFNGNQIGRGLAEVKQVVEASEFLANGSFLHSSSSSSDPPHSTVSSTKPTNILLIGYSYGSLISSSASAQIPSCIGYVAIAPPIGVQHWLLLFNSNHHGNESKKRTHLPRLYIIGECDNFTTQQQFLDTVASHSVDCTTGAVLKGADHFFKGRERYLINVIAKWLSTTYSIAEDSNDFRIDSHDDGCNGNLRRLLNDANFSKFQDKDKKRNEASVMTHGNKAPIFMSEKEKSPTSSAFDVTSFFCNATI